MSAELATFHSMDLGGNAESMGVTAFVGGKFGCGIQLSIGSNYCALSENQVWALVEILQKRLSGEYSATGIDLDLVIDPKER